MASIARELGELRGMMNTICGFLDKLDRNVSTVIIQYHEVGQKMVLHEDAIARHARRITDLCRKVDVAENTGVTHINETRTTWRTIKLIAGIQVGVVATFGATNSIYQSCKHKSQASSLEIKKELKNGNSGRN